MKKIIALAVASAFVAPVMAAEVTISGAMEFAHVDVDSSAALDNVTTLNEDSAFVIKASEELANGLSVSADFNIAGDGSADGGNSIDIKGEFGSLAIGDTSGAIDSFDDKGDVFFAFDNGIGGVDARDNLNGVSEDTGVAYKLPTFVPGLQVVLSYGPEDGDGGDNNDGFDSDMSGVGIAYSVNGIRFAAASEDVGTRSNEFYGVSGKFRGVGFAYEAAEAEDGADKEDYTSIMVNYTFDNVTLAYGNSQAELNDEKQHDSTTFGVHYSMGALTVFVESNDDDKAPGAPESTAFGVEYSF